MSPPARQMKDSVYAQLARIGKALAAPKRIELLDLLAQGPRTVEALAVEATLSVANASQHLRHLHAARLVSSEKRGLYVEYRLADAAVGRFVVALRTLATSQLAEVDAIVRAFFDAKGALESVDAETLAGRVRRGEVTVLDVRPAEEFRAGHIPGALSVPVPELKTALKSLPADRPVVAYCRGPYCVMAAEAVAILRKKGFEAHRLELGVGDWRARGWRVVREEAA